jgi:hypothetical protein
VPYYADSVPPHGLDHARVAAAAFKSFVFGGMGSWNDLSFQGDAARNYEQLTKDLYAAVMFALDATANFAGGAASGGSSVH